MTKTLNCCCTPGNFVDPTCHDKCTRLRSACNTRISSRVGRYFDVLIYSGISNRDYRIEAKNLSDDLSKLSSCSLTIVILLRNM